MKAVLIKKQKRTNKRVEFSSFPEMLEKTGITPKEFAHKTGFPYQTVKRFLSNGWLPEYYLAADCEDGLYSIPPSRTVREGIDVISADVRNSVILNRKSTITKTKQKYEIVFPKPLSTHKKLFCDKGKKSYGNLSVVLSEKIRQERIESINKKLAKLININLKMINTIDL